MDTLLKKLRRFLFRISSFHLSAEEKLKRERHLRGREQFKKLKKADYVIVSFGKSGRTWLRVMISRVYQIKYHLSQRNLIGFDNLHRKNPLIPKIFFSHDNYTKDFTGNADNKSDYYDKKVILLVRHPADVAVSQYFQWRYRMKPSKKAINDYPLDGEDVSIEDFVIKHPAGLDKAIDFMNLWASEQASIKDLLIVRYEDLKTKQRDTLTKIMNFMDTPVSDQQLADAIEFSSFDNMKKLESQRTFWLSGGRMKPKDRNNPHSFKVRKGKVGGYKEYFTEQQSVEIEAIIKQKLSAIYGYSGS
jgi:hypothetical protein